jgi:hypothetical protein
MKKVKAHADVKFHSQMPFTNVDVCFHTREEMMQLIAALQGLVEKADAQACVFLENSDEPPASDALPAEACFHAPGFVRDDLDLRCLSAARTHLESLTEDGKMKPRRTGIDPA